jgi:hypothetical protein
MSDFVTTGDPLVDVPSLIKWRGDGLTFVELLKYLPYLKGNSAYGMSDNNIVFWDGLSSECIKSLVGLSKAGIIVQTSTAMLTYMIDGAVPKLPLAKSNRKYKKLHWAPITFSLARNAAKAA